jgi:small subunit ribosomal protein S5
VTAGGRQLRFRASLVIGDGKGRVGLGIGKSGEVQGAIEKALRDAKKNIITFPIVNGTIPHDLAMNFKASSLFLHPAHPGTGIIAGGSVRKLLSVSGIVDIIAKQHGSSNGITNVRVAIKALAALKPLVQVRSFAKSSKAPAPKAEKAPKTEAAVKAPAKKAPAKKKAE